MYRKYKFHIVAVARMGCGASSSVDTRVQSNGSLGKYDVLPEIPRPETDHGIDRQNLTAPPPQPPPPSGPKTQPLPAIGSEETKKVGDGKTLSVEEFKKAFATARAGDQKTPKTTEQLKREQEIKQEQMRTKMELEKKAETILKQIEEAMALLDSSAAKSRGGENEVARKAMAGDIDMECPSPAKIVRIFTSSTFTDTMHERNTLMKQAYPRVKAHCRKIGYEFQVVDMRWGVRDEATDDHMGTELCLKELKLCQKLSTGPNFVSLLSHKYGYTAFPRVIEAQEFEAIVNGIDKQETKDLFHKWYTKDENMVPASYILSSISTHLPDFVSPDKDKKKAAMSQWWTESEAMQEAIGVSATMLFGEETARKYIMSVTESEVREGLIEIKDQDKHCLWLKRDIDDIEKQEANYQLSRYMECTGSEQKWTKSRKMLKELKEKQMEQKLSKDRILTYHVNWNETGAKSGINPDVDEQHRGYLQRMCEDFVSSMCAMIDQSVAERQSTDEPLVQETLHHISFCQSKCETFHGREESLEVMKQYLCGKSTQPFVVYGQSGSGKTSLMAKAAQMTKTWFSDKQVNAIIRFLGTSPGSSSIIPLLQSVTKQIRRNYSRIRREPSDKMDILMKEFLHALTMGKPEKPIVLFLDSIDQLDSSFDGRLMAWLPSKLPPNTKIIISTLPEAQYESYNAMKTKHLNEENYYQVPKLKDQEASDIIDKWLSMKNRRLTDSQKEIVLTAFRHCPIPLYLRMIFDEASTWTSFASKQSTSLPDGVQSCIEKLFDRLEKMHGHMLVSKALAYLTLSKNGLSESELEDILSCDDDVLNDVYVYWTPPIRRLPPLLLVRLRTDLSSYLVERGADGSRVLYWYHRQFIEAAMVRYCNQPEKTKRIHMDLADFFNGTWSKGRKKPYTTAKGESGEEDRHIADQPLTFGEKEFNLRTLNNLPYHRVHAGQLEYLKKECLANYEFLLMKVRAVPLIQVMEDYKSAIQAFSDDKLIKVIFEALSLSQKGLMHDPTQLAAQMIGRLENNEVTSDFLQQCLDYPYPYFQPNRDALTKPGGQLVSCLAGHKSDLDCIDMSSDGKMVVTSCQADREVILWNIEKHELVKNIQGLGQCTASYFCLSDTCIATEMEKDVRILDVVTGSKKFDVPMTAKNNNCIAVTGQNKDILVVFTKKIAFLHDLTKQGQLIQPVISKDMTFGGVSIAAATKNYVAVTDDEQMYFAILDVESRSFYPRVRGFEKIYDEEIEDYDEHEIEAMDFTPDESMVVYTNMFTSEVVFVDVKTGERKRYIEGDGERSYRGLNITDNGKFMYIRDSELLRIFDIETLQEIDSLEHPKDVQYAKSRDMNIVVTVAEDCNLRIWDRSRGKAESRKQERVGNYYTIQELDVHNIQRIPNPRYVVAMAKMKKNDEDTTLLVIDVLKDKVVRECTFPKLSSHSPKLSVTIDPRTVFIWSRHHGYVFDTESSKVVRKLKSALPKYSNNLVAVTKRNEIVTVTRGQKFLKVFDLQTGNVAFILKSDQTQKIEYLQVNDAGTMATASTDEGPLLVFDIENRKYLYSISNKQYDDFFASTMLVNDKKSHVIFSTDKPIPGLLKNHDITQAVVWDVENKKEVCILNDKVYQQKLYLEKSDDITSLDEIFFLDETRVISTHFDNVIRVFNYMQGTLLGRLTGHTTSVKLSVTPKGPYIFTYGLFSEEDCFRIWDKETYKCAASFTLDSSVSSTSLSSDGKFIITRAHQPADLFRWDIIHGDPGIQYKLDDYPEDFKGEVTGKVADLEIPEDYEVDPNDPDSDPEIPTEDEDDDDDDDV